ncbi:hypothetical protein [Corynebacterium pseudotuberculosis]|uniref:Uncharacterized protein n=1 Tax=Corynebacterium pseudotuberculosis (strain C231) TaxID=681645 RepID=D9QDK1_CORP2|nr:hypothetical protein [Corynebacterium pseudotuberculosis]ADK27871.1 hypothetical protein CPFRC_00390 [Corynebacterium pseudotuberculosis FRC41]ADL09574.1 hypothetical protein CPC231_00390 [Corynebacterium pseudotuberculosis C231]ADL19984.1 hypothetical protein CP1002_00390 [Corynebacterium pseudotuberculosis 1002]ADO25372.1 hypothetical protein CPI19_00390 [Corynebacterium pseudotuberculosis I19]AEP69354.1 Hypothetical protein Cp4202_0076 [Corynebacterium pseudotuberculosis 42/02-A]AFH5099
MEKDGSKKSSRKSWSYVMIMIFLLMIILVPPLLHLFTSGGIILTALLLLALTFGFIDARTFRFTASFPLLIGAAYFIAMQMYFNAGTWIYLPIMVVLAFIGGAFGDPRGMRSFGEDEG